MPLEGLRGSLSSSTLGRHEATCELGPCTRSPATKTSPLVGAARPEPMLSNVLLPHPEGPMMETTSPLWMRVLMFCTAVTFPALEEKRLSTLTNSMAGTETGVDGVIDGPD